MGSLRHERGIRQDAETDGLGMVSKGTRTSKTDSGVKRRSIIVTVLASLQTQIASFTLANMLAEVGRYCCRGFTKDTQLCFRSLGPSTGYRIRYTICRQALQNVIHYKTCSSSRSNARLDVSAESSVSYSCLPVHFMVATTRRGRQELESFEELKSATAPA